jgi:glycosyltransferase (activator-dependent family)
MPAVAHLHPIVPLAWALQSAGHEVRVASHPDMTEHITAAGLMALPVGQVDHLGALMREGASDPVLESIAVSLGAGPQEQHLHNALRYYQLAAFSLYYPTRPRKPGYRPMVDDLIAFARAWRPDLVLWDTLSFPGPLAARACGAAHGRIQYGLDYTAWARGRLAERRRESGGAMVEDLMAAAMLPELDRLGLAFDEDLILGQWTVDLLPPGMRLPLDLTYVPLRRVPYGGPHVVPDWLSRRPRRPRVCVTLGLSTRKFLAADSAALVGDLIDMAAEVDADFIATLNATQLQKVGSSLPANVSAFDYIPLDLVLPTCAAVVHHGGGGTFASAVTHRVPQFVPAPGEGGDRRAYAEYIHEREAGLMLEREQVSVESLREQITRLLHEPDFQQGTNRLHTDMLALPTPTEAVPVLTRLVADRRP